MADNISVLVTYHNEGILLERCLSSFTREQIREIIVCDDASTIPPQPFIPDLPFPVRIITNEKNLGPARSRNRLLAEAQGEFVHFHDADDWVIPGWSKAVLQKIGEHADVVLTEVSSFRQGKCVAKSVQDLRDLDEIESDLTAFALTHFILVPAGTYRRNLVKSMGGYPELWQSEDFYFHVKLLHQNPKLEIVLEPLVGIDLRQQGRSTNATEVWSSTLQAIRELSVELPANYGPHLSELAFQCGSMLFRNGAIEGAKDAFRFSFKVGRPKIEGRNLIFRAIARKSPIMAERIARLYRKMKIISLCFLISIPLTGEPLVVTKSVLRFQATGRPLIKINGQGDCITGNFQVSGKELVIRATCDLKKLSTGIGLRDLHMKDKTLETEKFSEASFEGSAPYQPGQKPFQGVLTLHGVKAPIQGVVSQDGEKIEFHWEVSLSTYQIRTPEYLGIKVNDTIKLTAIVEGRLP